MNPVDFLLAAVIIGLLVDRYLLARQHRRQDLEQRGFDAHALDTIDSIHSRSSRQVSEMATRIQRPEIIRPDVAPPNGDESPAPIYNDDFHLVGKVIEEDDNNGQIDDG